jgi:sulfur-carrier protein
MRIRMVRVLYFAKIAELLGTREEAISLPENVNDVATLLSHLEALRPALVGRLGSVRVAVNETFAEAVTPIAHGDVIALIPPVSGG